MKNHNHQSAPKTETDNPDDPPAVNNDAGLGEIKSLSGLQPEPHPDPGAILAKIPFAELIEKPITLEPDTVIERMVDLVDRRTGIGRPAATLACLSAVSAAFGPVVRLSVPLVGSVNTANHLVILKGNGSSPRDALQLVFGGFRELLHTNIDQNSRYPEEELKTDIAKAKLRLKFLEDSRNEFEKHDRLKLPKGMKLEQLIDNEKVRDFLDGGFPASEFRSQILECFDRRRQEFAASETDAEMIAFPTGMLEPMRVGDHRFRRTLSGDGGIFSLDESGLGLKELLRSGPSKRREIGRLWAASFESASLLVDGRPRLAEWQGGVSAVSPRLLGEILGNGPLHDTGFPQRTLFCVPDGKGEDYREEESDEETVAEFTRLLHGRFRFRSRRQSSELHLAEEAYPILRKVREIERWICHAMPQLAEFTEHFGAHTLKTALLLHLAAGSRVGNIISAETLETALQVNLINLRQSSTLLHQYHLGDESGRAVDQKLSIVVEKIRLKGELTRRQLRRSFHRMSSDQLYPLLDLAEAKGMLVEEDGHLRLPEGP